MNRGIYDGLRSDFSWRVPEHFNFGAAFDRHADGPSRAAMFWEDQSGNLARLTFADLRAQSNRIANVLAGIGVRRGDAVMLMLPRIPAWHAAFIATLKIGAIAVPCPATMRAADMVFRANHSGARAIVASFENAAMISDLKRECPSLEHYLIAGSNRTGWTSIQGAMSAASDAFTPAATRIDEPAIMFFTSGTTRDPKAVVHSHSYPFALENSARWLFDARAGEIHWSPADTGWAKGAFGALFGPWMNGAPIFMFHGRFDARRTVGLLASRNIATYCATPTEYRMILAVNQQPRALGHLRHCSSAGEPLPAEVYNEWRERFGLEIHDGFAQTETPIIVANLPGVPIRPGSMGLACPGYDVAIVGEDLNELPDGQTGEIAVRIAGGRPPGLFIEYRGNDQENERGFRGEWYLTGDHAERDDDGYFWYRSRADDVIISAGYRIGPAEVESVLMAHPDVEECAVVASPDAERGHIVKAFVQARAGAAANAELARELQEHVKRSTAPHKYPREIEFLDEMPRTVTGKIRRAELRDREHRKRR